MKYILILSLAANLVLIMLLLRDARIESNVSNAVVRSDQSDKIVSDSKSEMRQEPSVDPTLAFLHKRANTDNPDYREIYDFLRQAGWSMQVAKSIISAMIVERYDARIANELQMKEKWWRPEEHVYSEKGNALREEQRTQFEKYMFAVQGESTETQKAEMRRRYGDRLYSKANELDTISRDYSSVHSTLAEQLSAIGTSTSSQRVGLVRDTERAKEKDIRAILTPEEYRDWELRLSDSAGNVQRDFRNYDLSEQQYEAVFDVIKEWDMKFLYMKADAPSDAPSREEVVAGKEKRNKALAEILGPDGPHPNRNSR